MDFEAINEKMNKNDLMDVSVGGITVLEATESIRDELNIDPLIEISENHNIRSEQDAKQALSFSMQARKLRKTLDNSRLKIVRPHLDFQRAINSIVKDYIEKLIGIENRLKLKLDSWLELQSTFQPNFSEMMLEVEDGKISTKLLWEFHVEDFEKIPRHYLMIDEKKVKQEIKMGVRDIAGIKIFENKQTTMRVKNG